MTNLTKLLIGASVAAVGVGVTVHCVKKAQEKKYIDATPSEDAKDGVEKKPTIVERVKNYAMQKSVKMLTWVMLHHTQVEAATMVLGLVGSVLSVVNAVKEFSNGKKLQAKLDTLYSEIKCLSDTYNVDATSFSTAWNAKVDNDITRYNNLLSAISST